MHILSHISKVSKSTLSIRLPTTVVLGAMLSVFIILVITIIIFRGNGYSEAFSLCLYHQAFKSRIYRCEDFSYLSPVKTKGFRPNTGSTSGTDSISLSWKLLNSFTRTLLIISGSRINSTGCRTLNTPPYL